nr:hypothetical protein [Tanacetum cinerariifolium]
MAILVISISSDSSDESVGSSPSWIILFGTIPAEIPAKTPTIPLVVLTLPCISLFLCTDLSETPSETSKRPPSQDPYEVIVSRWRIRVVARPSPPSSPIQYLPGAVRHIVPAPPGVPHRPAIFVLPARKRVQALPSGHLASRYPPDHSLSDHFSSDNSSSDSSSEYSSDSSSGDLRGIHDPDIDSDVQAYIVSDSATAKTAATLEVGILIEADVGVEVGIGIEREDKEEHDRLDDHHDVVSEMHHPCKKSADEVVSVEVVVVGWTCISLFCTYCLRSASMIWGACELNSSKIRSEFLATTNNKSEDITDPTTAMNMALSLMAKAFKLNYSTPTNNNQRISSNPRNRQIAQPGQNAGNLNGYNVIQNVRNQVAQNPRIQNDGNQNQIGNEEYDLMAAAADLDEIEEVNANCILMANLQQASSSGTQTDSTPIYDTDGSAEVHENYDNNETFNMFTQEEQYTELLEPIPKPQQVPQKDNNVITEVTDVEQDGETVE